MRAFVNFSRWIHEVKELIDFCLMVFRLFNERLSTAVFAFKVKVNSSLCQITGHDMKM